MGFLMFSCYVLLVYYFLVYVIWGHELEFICFGGGKDFVVLLFCLYGGLRLRVIEIIVVVLRSVRLLYYLHFIIYLFILFIIIVKLVIVNNFLTN